MVYALIGLCGIVAGAISGVVGTGSSIILLPVLSLAFGPRQMALAGGLVGYLTGVVYSTGPLTIPIFAGFGLAKGALLATEAAASIVVYVAKALAFGAVGGLPLPVLCNGLVVGAALAAGTFLGKRFVLGMSEATFRLLIDAMLACAGLVMTGSALFG